VALRNRVLDPRGLESPGPRKEKGNSAPIDFSLMSGLSDRIEFKIKTESDCQGLKSQFL